MSPAKIDEPHIRLFKVPTAQSGLAAGNNQNLMDSLRPRKRSGLLRRRILFGRDLQKALNVPIGLIGSHVGGTAADKWISEKSLLAHPELKDLVARQRQAEPAYDPAKAEARVRGGQGETRNKPSPPARKPSKPPTLAGNPKGRGPASLYNAMIAPLQPFAFRGSSGIRASPTAGIPRNTPSSSPTLIADWRAAWNQRDFPFLFVQLPPFNAIPPELREIQSNVWKNTPHTGMVVITDHGSA